MDIKLPATITMLDSDLNKDPNRDPLREIGSMEALLITICVATICRALFLCCSGFIAHWIADRRRINMDTRRPVIPPPPPPPPTPLVATTLHARFRPGKL